MANKVHIVPHMHWDREWYFTAEESKILLVNDMEEVMTMLETNPKYPYYVLDGQTAVLEDYISCSPENKERVKRLVQEGKLIIGPWYTQTDEMVVGGESIVRNLLYGLKDCKEYGEPMMIGYLPDSFGQSAQLPQILNGFNIDRCMFWRGTSERMGTAKTEFIWKGADNSKVTTQLLPLGYAIGKYLPVDENALKDRMEKYFPVLDSGATTEHILLPNGHDQMPVQKNIFEVMESLKKCYPERDFFLSRYENVFDEIEKEDLPIIEGECLDGKYMRVHRSIYSSRADIKSSNTRIENKITNILEPLATIAYTLGFKYHHGLIENIWKEIMKNHAHDSIGCCCSDKVHKAIADRFFIAEDRVDKLIEYYKRKITDHMPMDIALDKLTVFNLLPYTRKQTVKADIITKMKGFDIIDAEGKSVDYEVLSKEIVDAGLIDRQIVHYGDYDPFVCYHIAFETEVPPMGYKGFLIKESNNIKNITVEKSDDNYIENENFKISINKNGSVNIINKNTNTEYKNVFIIEDGSDDGDGYDYSPLENDFIITSENVSANIEIEKCGHEQKAVIKFSMNIPKNLESRKANIKDSVIDVKLTLSLFKESDSVNVETQFENNSEDHRVRILIPSGFASSCSVSDNQFGVIKRDVVDNAMEVWEKEKWSERPDSIYPFLSYVTGENKDSLAVITNSVREYEFVGEDYSTIAITLFRCTGFLGKENMYRRPGRPSGIKMPTPDSQMKGTQIYNFAVCIKGENIARKAKEVLTPFVTYNKMPYNAMKLNIEEKTVPYEYSLLKEIECKAVLSTLKKAENNESIIIRFFNGSESNIDIELLSKYENIDEVKLDENTVVSKSIENRDMLNINEIKTYKLY